MSEHRRSPTKTSGVTLRTMPIRRSAALVVMLFFGYTNCPDECPATLAKMAQAVDRLGADGKRVQGLFVTVDPKRDTPAVLAKYVSAFHPTFVGLSADEATTAAMVKDFKVLAEPQKADEHGYYGVDH